MSHYLFRLCKQFIEIIFNNFVKCYYITQFNYSFNVLNILNSNLTKLFKYYDNTISNLNLIILYKIFFMNLYYIKNINKNILLVNLLILSIYNQFIYKSNLIIFFYEIDHFYLNSIIFEYFYLNSIIIEYFYLNHIIIE